MDGARTLVDPDSGNYYAANAGAVVVLDARTGSVVAMASNPSFDPNDFINGDADKYFKDPNFPLINRALNAYAPGSTFKTITSIAMLQSGLFHGGAEYTLVRLPRRLLQLRQRREAVQRGQGGARRRRPPGALTVSSDVYFYTVGNEFWNALPRRGPGQGGYRQRPRRRRAARRRAPRRQRDPAHRARRTGSASRVASASATRPGVIPNHEYRVKLNPDDVDNQFWRRGDSASLAVGQGDVLVTPLQLANAYAAFANGGTLYQPRLVDAVTESSAGLPAGQLGPVVSAIDPQVKRTTGLTPEVRDPDRSRARRRDLQLAGHRLRRLQRLRRA